MVKFIKEYWFGLLLSIFMFFFAVFIVIIATSPHNDAKLRGFTPCTYQLAVKMGQSEKAKIKDVMSAVNQAYICYFQVMYEGMLLYLEGKQSSPWANYRFEPIIDDGLKDDLSIEPFPDDLLKSDLLNKEENPDEIWDGVKVKEKENNVDENEKE